MPANNAESRSGRSPFQPMCGTDSAPAGKRSTTPGITPSPATPGDSSLPSNSDCSPMQMPKNGRPAARYSRNGST